MAEDIGVHGELFYSQAFITAHCELQDVPLDSVGSCSFPQCIVVLMLWLDATQLTSFGDTNL